MPYGKTDERQNPCEALSEKYLLRVQTRGNHLHGAEESVEPSCADAAAGQLTLRPLRLEESIILVTPRSGRRIRVDRPTLRSFRFRPPIFILTRPIYSRNLPHIHLA